MMSPRDFVFAMNIVGQASGGQIFGVEFGGQCPAMLMMTDEFSRV